MNYTGINLRNAVTEARRFGCRVWVARRTGEYVVQAPDGERVRVNCRRKDAPRELTGMLNTLLRNTPTVSQHGPAEVVEATTTTTVAEPESHDTEELEALDVGDTFPEGEIDDVEEGQPPSEPEQPPVAATAPPPQGTSGKRPSLKDRLDEIRRLRESLICEAEARVDELTKERQELTEMLGDVDTELTSLKAEILGVRGGGKAVNLAIRRDPDDMDRSLPDRTPVLEFLGKHRGVWFTGREIRTAVGFQTEMPSKILTPMVEAGDIERRGKLRGTMYRLPAITAVQEAA